MLRSAWSLTCSANSVISLLVGQLTYDEFNRAVGSNALEMFESWAVHRELADVSFESVPEWDDDLLTFYLSA